MRSLPNRFESKVTAIEENDTYKDMKPSEVIGRLLTYESRKATTSPRKKKNNLALKSFKVEEEEDDSNEDMTLIAKGFKKFLNLQKSGMAQREMTSRRRRPQSRMSSHIMRCLQEKRFNATNVEDSGISPRMCKLGVRIPVVLNWLNS